MLCHETVKRNPLILLEGQRISFILYACLEKLRAVAK